MLKLWGSCHGRLSTDVRTSDGIQLHQRRWLPESGCRAVVCLVHGLLGEHSGRYQHFGEAFAAHGLGVYTFDLRGHGQSGGRRSHTPSYGWDSNRPAGSWWLPHGVGSAVIGLAVREAHQTSTTDC